jgi:hypothetical protein
VGARVVVPLEALSLLCRGLRAEELSNFGHAMGNEAGRRVAERLGRDLGPVTTQQMVEHLGGELALMGFGSLSIEIWGQAMVATVVDSPLVFGDGASPDSGDRLLAAVLCGALLRATSRELAVVTLSRLDNTVRFVVCSRSAQSHVEAWLSDGSHYGEALARLNETGATA